MNIKLTKKFFITSLQKKPLSSELDPEPACLFEIQPTRAAPAPPHCHVFRPTWLLVLTTYGLSPVLGVTSPVTVSPMASSWPMVSTDLSWPVVRRRPLISTLLGRNRQMAAVPPSAWNWKKAAPLLKWMTVPDTSGKGSDSSSMLSEICFCSAATLAPSGEVHSVKLLTKSTLPHV